MNTASPEATIEIGFISVLISLAYPASSESSEDTGVTDRSAERGSDWACCLKKLTIKCYRNGCHLFSGATTWCGDAKVKISRFSISSSFSSCRHRDGDERGKREIEVEGCVIQRPMVYWSLCRLSVFLSSQQGGVNWTVFFCSDWRMPCVSNVFKLAAVFSADWNDFFFFFFCARRSLLKWHNSLSAHCVWADRWRVLSWTTYSALWQLCQQKNKRERTTNGASVTYRQDEQNSRAQSKHEIMFGGKFFMFKNPVVLQSKC